MTVVNDYLVISSWINHRGMVFCPVNMEEQFHFNFNFLRQTGVVSMQCICTAVSPYVQIESVC